MPDDHGVATTAELEHAIRVLFNARDEYMVRLEAVRVLCEHKGIFSEDEFQAMVSTLQARARDEEDRVRAHLQPGRLESLAALLRRYEGPSQ